MINGVTLSDDAKVQTGFELNERKSSDADLSQELAPIEEPTYNNTSFKEFKLHDKIKEYNTIINALNTLEFSLIQKDEAVRGKHKWANVLNRTATVAGCICMVSWTGFGLSALCSPGGIVPCLITAGASLAVGLACGIPSTIYINKRVKDISTEELVEYYSQKAEGLKQEIDELKQKLDVLG